MPLSIRQSEHTMIRAGSGEPVSLGKPGAAWLVHAGHAEVFLARVLPSGAPGARIHVIRVEAGSALFGMDLDPLGGQWDLIAEFGPEAEADFVHRDSLTEASASIGRWVSRLRESPLCRGEAGEGGPVSRFEELDAFHVRMLGAMAAQVVADQEKERTRIARRIENDAAGIERSIYRLAEPLNRSRQKTKADDETHPLMRACQAIGRAQHIVFTPPPEVPRGLPLHDPVRAVCRSSGIRSRRVALEENWHKREGLPLLAFRESDRRPMALLPRRRGGYDIFDPVEGVRARVTEETAAALEPFAHTFYKPFHTEPVTLKYLFMFGLAGTWGDLLWVLVYACAVGLIGLATPLITKTVFDIIIPGAQRDRMVQTALFLLAAGIASSLFTLARGFAFLRVENQVESRVLAAVFDRLLSLPAHFFRGHSSGELAQRAGAIGAIRRMLSNSAVSGIFAGIFSVFNLFLLFRFQKSLAFVAVGLTLIQLVVYLVAAYLAFRVQRRAVELQVRVSGLMLQLIGGMAKFRVSGTESRAFALWSKMAAETWSLTINSARIGTWVGVFNSVFPLLSSIAIFWFMGSLIEGKADAGITTGSFLAFGSAYGSFSGGLISLAQSGMALLAVGPIYETARPILDAVPEINPLRAQAGDLSGRIELSHVCFRYSSEGPLVLKDISLSIAPGQFVAIVGPSGSGKSTIFRILLGFEEPESGAVFYDGQDLSVIDAAGVRQKMGVVLQNSTVFSGDIFQNIVCSAPYTLDQAWDAARRAGLAGDLEKMPMGMHTIVGEGGAGLSGGQRQRLMIARAIVGTPRILLFDEATSALDNQTQALLSQSLQAMRATRVVIAHRLTTIMKADLILVVDKGEIVQSGTYSELMAQPGVFAELAKRQLT